MNVKEVVEAALELAQTFSEAVTLGTWGSAYRRAGARQHELFTIAAGLNPARFGSVEAVTVTDGVGELPEDVEKIEQVEILDPGESDYEIGAVVEVVQLLDQASVDPPRVTIRGGVVAQVADDLDGVDSLNVFYARQSAPIGAADLDAEIELPAGHQELLVYDLAKWLLRRDDTLTTERKSAAVGFMEAREQEAMALFTAHVVGYAPIASRH